MRPRERRRELNNFGHQALPPQGLWNGPELTGMIQAYGRGRLGGPLNPWGPSSPTRARMAPGKALGKDSERGS